MTRASLSCLGVLLILVSPTADGRCLIWGRDTVAYGRHLSQLASLATSASSFRFEGQPKRSESPLTLVVSATPREPRDSWTAIEIVLAHELCATLERVYPLVQVVIPSLWTKEKLLRFLEARGRRGDHFAFVGHNGILGQNYVTRDARFFLAQQRLVDFGFPKLYLGGCESEEEFRGRADRVEILAYDREHAEIFFLAEYPDSLVNERPTSSSSGALLKAEAWRLIARAQKALPKRLVVPAEDLRREK